MKFTSLTIENFLAVGEASIGLADRGLVLIQGVNEDDSSASSNGSGKSSVADALCWALFGSTARGVSGDGVINNVEGKGCRVIVTLKDGDDTFEIARHRKHKTGKNTLTLVRIDVAGAREELTLGTDKLTQERVEKLIGASYDVFKAAVYAGQEQMPDLPAMTDKHLKVLVEEAAGVTILEAAYEEARKRLSVVKEATVSAVRALERDQYQLERAKGDLVTAQENYDAFELQREADKEARKAAAIAARDRAIELAKQYKDGNFPEKRRQRDEAELKLRGVDIERDEEKRLLNEIQVIERQVATHQADLRNLTIKAKAEKEEFENVAHKVGCPCTTCGQALTEAAVAPAQERAKTKLQGTVVNVRTIKSDLDASLASRKTLTDALEAHRASMTDVSSESALCASLNAELSQLADIAKTSEYEKEKAHTLAANVKEIASKVNPFDTLREKAKAAIAASGEAAKTAEVAIEKAAAAEKTAEVVAKVFSPAGVRAHILDDVTPFLNDQTAKYLSTLSDGNITATWTTLVKTAKGELREKFSIEVEKAKGGSTFAALSGGEKRKVRVATALALQDLVARRAVKPIELFIGDEIDDALDQSGLERLTEILEEKARERGSVFVISHHSLRDWISQVAVVTMKDGKASLVEAVV